MKTNNSDPTNNRESGGKWTIGKKLTVSFMSMAGITLIVALLGFGGAKILTQGVTEIGEVRLPGVQNMLEARLEAETLHGEMTKLVAAGVPFEERTQSYHNIEQNLKGFEEAIDLYKSLPQSEEEARIWANFDNVAGDWRNQIEIFLNRAKEFDQLGLEDPVDLSSRLEKYMKEHYLVVQDVMKMIYVENEVFTGGDDHTACNAGRYLPAFESNNR